MRLAKFFIMLVIGMTLAPSLTRASEAVPELNVEFMKLAHISSDAKVVWIRGRGIFSIFLYSSPTDKKPLDCQIEYNRRDFTPDECGLITVAEDQEKRDLGFLAKTIASDWAEIYFDANQKKTA